MYTTDKSLTYHQDKGHYGKFLTCVDILKGKAEKHIKSLYNLYQNAIDTTYSLAHIEVRVPVAAVKSVLLNVPGYLLQESLVSFSREEWW